MQFVSRLMREGPVQAFFHAEDKQDLPLSPTQEVGKKPSSSMTPVVPSLLTSNSWPQQIISSWPNQILRQGVELMQPDNFSLGDAFFNMIAPEFEKYGAEQLAGFNPVNSDTHRKLAKGIFQHLEGAACFAHDRFEKASLHFERAKGLYLIANIAIEIGADSSNMNESCRALLAEVECDLACTIDARIYDKSLSIVGRPQTMRIAFKPTYNNLLESLRKRQKTHNKAVLARSRYLIIREASLSQLSTKSATLTVCAERRALADSAASLTWTHLPANVVIQLIGIPTHTTSGSGAVIVSEALYQEKACLQPGHVIKLSIELHDNADDYQFEMVVFADGINVVSRVPILPAIYTC